MYNRLDRKPACDGQTDGQTDILRRHSPRYAYASRGKHCRAELEFWQMICIPVSLELSPCKALQCAWRRGQSTSLGTVTLLRVCPYASTCSPLKTVTVIDWSTVIDRLSLIALHQWCTWYSTSTHWDRYISWTVASLLSRAARSVDKEYSTPGSPGVEPRHTCSPTADT